MVKKFLLKILLGFTFYRCRIKFWLFGPYGVADVLKTAPFPFIQPILIRYGAKVGENCVIDTGMIIHRPDRKSPFKNLIIDDNCYIGHNNLFDLSDEVHIEHDVGLGAFCQLWTHVGDYKTELTNRIDDYHERIAAVLIEPGSVLYSGVIVSPGVKIGEGSRIGAGSVVLGDVESKFFYAGVPAKRIKSI